MFPLFYLPYPVKRGNILLTIEGKYMTKSKKTESFDQPCDLMIRTAELLKERNLFDVFTDTKIPYFWLAKFNIGEFKNPSVNRVVYLYEYLTKSKIV